MSAWTLVPCLAKLRDEFNTVAPARDKASDGAIGDTAHQAETSDHNPDETGAVPIHDADSNNEVHAIDVDSDLRESDLTMERVVQFLLGRVRSGAERRLRYIIYSRRIWKASNDWRLEDYTGASAHTEHAHFSASYESALEASVASWHLEEIPVALTAADKLWIADTVADTVEKRIFAHPIVDQADTADPKRKLSLETWISYTDSRRNSVLSALTALAGKDFIDEGAIAAIVLAGLNPEQLATMIASKLPRQDAQQTLDMLAARLAA